MNTFQDVNSYFKRYCTYYLALEADFIATERFVTIDKDNAHSFSVEYIKQLQTICSEVEVVAKYLSSIIDDKSKCNDFTDCCKIIMDSNPLFHRATTTVPQLDGFIIAPFFIFIKIIRFCWF